MPFVEPSRAVSGGYSPTADLRQPHLSLEDPREHYADGPEPCIGAVPIVGTTALVATDRDIEACPRTRTASPERRVPCGGVTGGS